MRPDARLLRQLGRAFATGVGIAAPALAITSVIGTKLLTDAPRVSLPKPTLRVRFHSVDSALAEFHVASEVVEVRGPEAAIPGRWGLRLEDAFVLVDDPLHVGVDEDGPYALRPWRPRDGTPPTAQAVGERRVATVDRRTLRPADVPFHRRRRDRRREDLDAPWPYPAVLSAYAWPDDPQVLARENDATWEVEAVPSDAGGHLPAWRLTPPEPDGTWLVAVHGRGARRAEVFRLVDIALRAGTTCLVISYRTDAWTRDPAPYTTLGMSEWHDVDAAIRLALSRGASSIVLAGCSMGGGIVATTLRRSELSTAVGGVVLDAPALDWGPTLRHIAQVNRVPPVLVPMTMAAARIRAKLDFQALNHVAAADEFAHPILLFHGTADDVTPVWLSDTLAEVRPDLVFYVRVEGAGHVKSWNHAPDRYEDALRRFLTHAAGVALATRAGRRQRLLGLRRAQLGAG